MDETVSFGTLGKTGRGVTEHYNVPVTEFNHIFDICCIIISQCLSDVNLMTVVGWL